MMIKRSFVHSSPKYFGLHLHLSTPMHVPLPEQTDESLAIFPKHIGRVHSLLSHPFSHTQTLYSVQFPWPLHADESFPRIPKHCGTSHCSPNQFSLQTHLSCDSHVPLLEQ